MGRACGRLRCYDCAGRPGRPNSAIALNPKSEARYLQWCTPEYRKLVAIPTPLRRYRLPLVTLYVTERCNSRCVTCDYWRHGRSDINLESVTRLLPSLAQLGTKLVVLRAANRCCTPNGQPIAQLSAQNGLEVWLLTSGLALAKHARRAADLFNTVTVSLDGD